MSEIPKAYEPQSVEDKWYDFWQKNGCFTANEKSSKPAYSIVIPPPNVTGMLHMGHVLNNTIQDILSRKARMDGKEVLWLPGTDHAGIATQVQVEKQLKKEEHKTKHDVGREEFLKRVWAWKEKHGGIIINQLKKLGCSCDWTRERFTMDPEYSRCVQKVFVELYKKGLIYRGKRMVNWCPATQTALSDEEVEMKPQKGFMYHFRVEAIEADGSPVKGVSGRPLTPTLSPDGGEGAAPASGQITDSEGRVWLTIATTRPETIPADTAVAVNPKDLRYTHLIGKHVYRALPLDQPKEQRRIPIIADEHVDFEFGTGVLKVTPAHDKADFDIGLRHKLLIIDVLTPDAKMTAEAGADLAGLDRFVARKKAAEILEAAGTLDKAEPYENNVGFSQRADVPIEPRLSEQWFLKYPAVEQSKACVEQEGSTGHWPVPSGDPPDGTGAGVAIQSAASWKATSPHVPVGGSPTGTGGSPVLPGKMRFHPQRWAKVYDHWLTNIQDWCISRQLWWGHRIPVWRKRTYLKDLPEKAKEIFEHFRESEKYTIKDPDGSQEALPADLLRESASKIKGEFSFFRALESTDEYRECEVVTYSEAEARELEKLGFTQDPDVLDTWFSSWLWPFATMGWPEQTETLKKFYPTTDLVTGPDIIFFWVARMIMAGYEFMGEMPFRTVYFTGIIRDKNGDKMSKSLGNSPDPIPLMARYGADAVRFGILRATPTGADAIFEDREFDRFSKDKRYDFANIEWKTERFPQLELARNLCNKLWNACRFRQMQGGEVQGEITRTLLTPDDKWILLKLDSAIREVTIALNEYKFAEATSALYRFFWSEYCDWYVEASKAVLSLGRSRGDEAQTEKNENKDSQRLLTSSPTKEEEARKANTLAVIDFVLSHTLRLFHPFLPFITEELWHGMGYSTDMPESQGGKTIMNAPWPMPINEDEKGEWGLDDCYLEMTDTKYELVTQGRNLRRVANIQAAKKVKYVFKPSQHLTEHDAEVIKLLLNAEALEVNADYQAPKGTPSVQSKLGELFLPLDGHVDKEAEKIRLGKEMEKIKSEITKVEQKLANPNFTEKVPPAVLKEHHQRLADWQGKLAHTQVLLDGLI